MKKFLDITGSLCIFIFIISFAVVVTLNFKPLYYMNIESSNLSEISGFSNEIIKENYDILIDYNSMFNFSPLEFNSIPMSPEGKIHFEEVKVIFVGLQILLIVSFIASIFFIYKKIRKKDYHFLLLSSIFTISIPAILGSIIAINWEWCFITFHKIAFRNDYWIFNPIKDPIITILPDSFFMQCAVMIVSIALLLSVSLFVWWKISYKKP